MGQRTFAILIFSLALGACFFPMACSPQPAERYSVRGVVVSVEPQGDGFNRVTLFHEEIPPFKNASGQVVGMEPMAMTFKADRSVSLAGIEPRTKVHFVFEMRWNESERLILREISPIDSDTPLEFKGYSVEFA